MVQFLLLDMVYILAPKHVKKVHPFLLHGVNMLVPEHV